MLAKVISFSCTYQHMPDESCRKCGGGLIDYARCTECKGILFRMCKRCCNVIPQNNHIGCFQTGFSHSVTSQSSLRINSSLMENMPPRYYFGFAFMCTKIIQFFTLMNPVFLVMCQGIVVTQALHIVLCGFERQSEYSDTVQNTCMHWKIRNRFCITHTGPSNGAYYYNNKYCNTMFF